MANPRDILKDPLFLELQKTDPERAKNILNKLGIELGPDTSKMTERERQFRAGAKEVNEMSGPKRLLTALGGGVVSLGRGVAAPFVSPETKKQWEYEAGFNAPLKETTEGSAGFGLEKGLEMTALPSTRGLSFIPRVAAESAMQGGLEAARLPDPGETRLQNAALGAGSGVAAEGLSSLGAKTVNTFLDRPYDAATRNLVDTAKPNKIPITYADTDQLGSSVARRVAGATERVPILGSGGTRTKQSIRADKGTQQFIDEMYPTGMTRDTPEIDKQVFLSDAIKDKYKEVRNAAGAKYAAIPPANPATPVDMTISGTKAAQLRAEFPTILTDPDIPASTKSVIERLAEEGQVPQSITDVIDADKALGKLIRQEKARLVRSGGSEEKLKMLKELRGGLKQDTYAWAQQTGQTDFMDALLEADRNFATTVMPFRNNPVTRKVLYEAFDPDRLFAAVTRKNAPGLAKDINALMTPAGTQLRQAEALKAVYDSSFDGTTFMPQKFVNNLKAKLGSTTETLFTPKQKEQLQGWVNLLEHIGAAGPGAKATSPGFSSQVASGISGGAITAGTMYGLSKDPATTLLALKGVGVVLTSAKLFTTDVGRRLLTSASTLKPGSKELNRFVVQADKLLKGYVAKELQTRAQRKGEPKDEAQ